MPVVVNEDLLNRTSDARADLVRVTGHISVVGILVGRSIHPIPNPEKHAEDGNYGADDNKTAGGTVPGFFLLIGIAFLIRATRRRSSGDTGWWGRVFFYMHSVFCGL